MSLRPLEEANYIIGKGKERERDPYALNILAPRPKLAISHTKVVVLLYSSYIGSKCDKLPAAAAFSHQGH